MSTSYVTVTDQFCGAGGSSTGAKRAGAEIRLALNHWPLAIRTHNTNHPEADHDCTDVSACDPRRYPSTTILITSPECTNHTIAKGKAIKWRRQLELFGKLEIDPAEERSRATMWDVVRFAEYHRYKVVIVENVVDARWWEPFDAWMGAMDSLGYDHHIVYFNSMFAHPTPQSRDRMYVVFWLKKLRRPNLDIRPGAFCPQCGKDVAAKQSWKNPRKPWGKYLQQYVYRCPECAGEVTPYYYCAWNAIDWTIPIQRIGERKRPLKEKTMKRIRIGLEKFGRRGLLVGNYSPGWARPLSQPTGAVTTTDHHALLTPPFLPTQTGSEIFGLAVPPFTIETQWSHAEGDRSSGLDDALPTQTAQQGRGLVVTVPMLVSVNHSSDRARPITDPAPTTMPQGNPGIVVPPPFIVKLRGEESAQSGERPLGTVTAGGNHHGVLMPPAFLSSYYGTGGSAPIEAGVPTVTGTDRHALVVPPPFLVSYYTRTTGQQAAVQELDAPVPTVPGWAVHYLAQPAATPANELPAVDDCGFRMLQPEEIKSAMAFPADYVILGTQRDQVKQAGNAVTPPVMEILVRRCLEVLG